ncbi:MAG TPA: phage protein Gp27 family protein [Burkholderiales bacterium]|nr:phage protein Gp27 family protein [Burkholderiales bacterium]
MPRRPKIEGMPPDVRAWIDRALVDRGFAGYQELAALIREKTGIDISHAAVHRYGQRLARKLAAIRASTEAARAIAEAAPDDADLRSAAVISIVQSELFDALVALQEASETDDQQARVKLLSHAARAIAEVSRASLGQKRWQDEVRERLAKLETEAGKTGRRLDAETLKAVREQLYGG